MKRMNRHQKQTQEETLKASITAYEALGQVDARYVLESELPGLSHPSKKRTVTAAGVWARMNHSSGIAAAISLVVALGVLSALIWAGRAASVTPPSPPVAGTPSSVTAAVTEPLVRPPQDTDPFKNTEPARPWPETTKEPDSLQKIPEPGGDTQIPAPNGSFDVWTPFFTLTVKDIHEVDIFPIEVTLTYHGTGYTFQGPMAGPTPSYMYLLAAEGDQQLLPLSFSVDCAMMEKEISDGDSFTVHAFLDLNDISIRDMLRGGMYDLVVVMNGTTVRIPSQGQITK